jgi:hypothetical protein
MGQKWPKMGHISGRTCSWPKPHIPPDRGSQGAHFRSPVISFDSPTFLRYFEKSDFSTPIGPELAKVKPAFPKEMCTNFEKKFFFGFFNFDDGFGLWASSAFF